MDVVVNNLNTLTTEQRIEVFKPCMIKYILQPRFKLIALMDELFKFMLQKQPVQNNIQHQQMTKKFEETSQSVTEWINLCTNKLSEKLKESFIPKEVIQIIQRQLKLDIMEYLIKFNDEHNLRSPEVQSRLDKRVDEMISEYFHISKPTTKKKYSTKIIQSSTRKQSSAFVQPTQDVMTFKDRERYGFAGGQLGTVTEWDLDTREGKRMHTMSHMIDLKNMKKRQDDLPSVEMFQRFARLWKIRDQYVTYAENIWQTIVTYAKKNNQQIKIHGADIKAQKSNIILHGFILGILSLIDLNEIERGIISIGTDYNEQISPAYIMDHSKNTPNKNVQNILQSMFLNTGVHNDYPNLMLNWSKIQYPSVSATKLKDLFKHEKESYTINVLIDEIEQNQPQHSSIDWFVNKFKESIARRKIKLSKKFSDKTLKDHLQYERISQPIESKLISPRNVMTIVNAPSTITKPVTTNLIDETADEDDDFF